MPTPALFDTAALASDVLPELPRPRKAPLVDLVPTAVFQWSAEATSLRQSRAVGNASLAAPAREALPAAAVGALLTGSRHPRARDEPATSVDPATLRDVGTRCEAMAIVYALPGTDMLAILAAVDGGAATASSRPAARWTVVAQDAAPGRWATLASATIEPVPRSASFGARTGDLDGNGSPDLLAVWGADGSGLAGQMGAPTVILTDRPGRRAAVTELGWTSGLGTVAVRDPGVQLLVQDFVRCDRCTDGKPHNFWTYDVVGFRDLRPVAMNDAASDMPRFEWLSFRPEDRTRALLTPAMKRDLHPGWAPKPAR
jgi:hypothetical protein